MLIGRERFEEVYNTIKQSACAGGACTVLILVAPDCDAVCGCHILTRLLRDDNVPFKVAPVAGYGDVAAATVDVADAFSEIFCLPVVDEQPVISSCAVEMQR